MNILIEPSDTPLNIGMMINEDNEVWACSPCCKAAVHWNYSERETWKCSTCGSVVRTDPLPPVPDGTSMMSQEEIGGREDWVAEWTGLTVDTLTIEVTW